MRKQIIYEDPSGYTGVLFGRSSLIIFGPDGRERVHSGSCYLKTLEELKDVVKIYIDGLKEYKGK